MTHLRSERHQYWLGDTLLGKGQFGKVRKAICLTTGETFACKTVEAVGETVYHPERVTLHCSSVVTFLVTTAHIIACFTQQLLTDLYPAGSKHAAHHGGL